MKGSDLLLANNCLMAATICVLAIWLIRHWEIRKFVKAIREKEAADGRQDQ